MLLSYIVNQFQQLAHLTHLQSSCTFAVIILMCSLLLFFYKSMTMYFSNDSADTKVSRVTMNDFESIVLEKFPTNFSLNTSLAPYTRLRVGGNSQIFFRPSNLEQLVLILKMKPKELPVTPLGMGSNLLVRDGGVPGLVIQIVGRGFAQFHIRDSVDKKENEKIIEVGAGMSQLKFAKLCARAGISGLEFFCGIPGTIGGALRMNAGAHGTQVSDRLISATVIDSSNGQKYNKTVAELKYSYRHCELPKNWIFTSGVFKGDYLIKSREEIEAKIEELLSIREESQPVNEKTAGCTFINPVKNSAWKLISDAGCAGKVVGGAQVSKKHCNFLINVNSATALDLETLGQHVQDAVLQNSGIHLQWEVERIGVRLGDIEQEQLQN